MDNPLLHDYNIDKRAEDFIAYVKKVGKYFLTNNVAITTGMDFHYQAAHAWFNNLDKIIAYINKNSDEVNIFYSTPSCYLKETF